MSGSSGDVFACRECAPKWPLPAPAKELLDGLARSSSAVPDPKAIVRKVAIVGFSETTRGMAPFEDRTWEIWSLGSMARQCPRITRAFEFHNEAELRRVHKATYDDFIGWYAAQAEREPGSVIVSHLGPLAGRPGVERFPLIEITRSIFGVHGEARVRDALAHGGALPGVLWTNSIAYMMALALYEGVSHVGLFGVDMAHQIEYVEQRHGVTLLLGMLMGRGIHVHIPPQSALLWSDHVYGYQDTRTASALHQVEAWCADDVAAIEQQQREAVAAVNHLAGQIEAAKRIAARAAERRRGGLVVEPKP